MSYRRPQPIHINDLFDVSVDSKNLVDVGDENVQNFSWPLVSTPRAGERGAVNHTPQRSKLGQSFEETWNTILPNTPGSIGKPSAGLGPRRSSLGAQAGGLSRRQSSGSEMFKILVQREGGVWRNLAHLLPVHLGTHRVRCDIWH
eukprot:1177797-Prorocentrum_minimum.AAC.3